MMQRRHSEPATPNRPPRKPCLDQKLLHCTARKSPRRRLHWVLEQFKGLAEKDKHAAIEMIEKLKSKYFEDGTPEAQPFEDDEHQAALRKYEVLREAIKILTVDDTQH